MSGGYLDYPYVSINEPIREIESVIENNGDVEEDEFGCTGFNFQETTINTLEEGLRIIKQAQIYLKRIDYLLSGDHGEESFRQALEQDLLKLGE